MLFNNKQDNLGTALEHLDLLHTNYNRLIKVNNKLAKLAYTAIKELNGRVEYADFINTLKEFGLTDDEIDTLELPMFREQYIAEHSYKVEDYDFGYCGEYAISLCGIARISEKGKCKICGKVTDCRHKETGDYYCSKICYNVEHT